MDLGRGLSVVVVFVVAAAAAAAAALSTSLNRVEAPRYWVESMMRRT